MNYKKLLTFGALLIAALIMTPSAAHATSSGDCVTIPDGSTGNYYQMSQYFSSSFSRTGDQGTVTVKRLGSKPLCKDQPMVAQSFNMGPNWNGKPDGTESFLSSLPQTMAYATHFTFGKDETTKTVKVQTPHACYGTQLDVYVGDQEQAKIVNPHDGELREFGGKIFQPTEKCEEKKVKVCDPKTGNIISVPESEAGKYEDVNSEKCVKKVKVCDPKTGNIITVPESDKDKYEDVNSDKCVKVEVCDPSTGTIITVPKSDADKYEDKDSPKCVKIQVCVKDSGDTTMKTITKDEFDSSKHSTNPDDCVKPETPTTPPELPSTGPEAIIGGIASTGALTYGAYTYHASRRTLRGIIHRD